MKQTPLLSVIDLKRAYSVGTSSICALAGVNLSVYPGEFVAIMGASGSGKSTLMHVLGLLDTPSSGKCVLSGVDTHKLSFNERARLRNQSIGIIFQAYHLLPRVTALDNVALPLLYSDVNKADCEQVAYEALKRVHLQHRAGHRPAMLSGGEQQRVAIARALVNKPEIILADEPTGALDSRNGRDILRLLREINADGTSVILVTHDNSVARFAERIITMRDGRIVSDALQSKTPISSSDATRSPIRYGVCDLILGDVLDIELPGAAKRAAVESLT